MKLSVSVSGIMLAVLVTSGCETLDVIDKYARFQFWEIYRTPVQYWIFEDGVRIKEKYSPKVFPARVADNKSYVSFVIDNGSQYNGLPIIYTDNIPKDSEP